MKQATKRVVIIGLDGAGNMIDQANTPNIDKALKGGFITYEAQTVLPTISGECWGSMFHGVKPSLHGLTNERAEHRQYPIDSPYPSFMRLVKEADPSAVIASFSAWKPINDGIIEEGIADYVSNVHADKHLVKEVAAFSEQHQDFKLMFIQFDGIDGAGHSFGYGSTLFHEVIEETDELIGQILDILRAKNRLEDTLIIFLSDHGGGGADPKNHGSDHPKDVTIFWGCAGPNVVSNAEAEPVAIEDTAAVVAYALGIDSPDTWSAKVPAGLFKEESR
ncbi:alkaline phosphatase family protein [Paenibacillus agaridevorans]|uniref:alkaline phosphatase family protein n=1 Tax=Paenibacillus agaridevorans TaxID=171404 RepID=UPI001BE4DDEB|nr:alkaline phosphatase family protein [Paenibacillus agaridevorans]